MTMIKKLSVLMSVALILMAVNAVASPTDEDYEGVGRAFASSFNGEAGDDFLALFDTVEFVKLVVKTVSNNPKEQRALAQQMDAPAKQIPKRLYDEFRNQQGVLKYMRVHEVDGVRGPLVRVDFDSGGVNYLLLKVGEAGDGFKVRDVFTATNGQWMSDTVGAVGQLFSRPSESILERLFNNRTYNTKEVLSTLRSIVNLKQKGDIAAAYKKFDALPEQVRNEKVMIDIAIQLAILLGDEFYREELNRLATHHGDNPEAAMMLIDYYFFEERYEEAHESISLMKRTFGEDSALLMLQAGFEFARQDYLKTIEYASRGVELEPEFEGSYGILLEAYVAAKQFPEAISVMETLERDFDYFFTLDIFESPEYKDFAESSAFQAWADSKN